MRAEIGPEAVGLQQHDRDEAAVLRRVGTDERVRDRVAVERRHVDALVELRRRHLGAEAPQPEAEQRDVDDRRDAGPLASRERGRDAARDREAAEHIAERGSLVDRPLGLRVLERHRQAGARPVRRTVEAAPTGLRSAGSLARAAHVDHVGVAGTDVVDVDAKARPHVGQVVGDEDVGALDQAVQQLTAAVGREVEGDRALPPVGDLEHEVHAAGAGHESRRHQTALRVAALRVLDLDDVGAPLGEHRARDRHERPRRHLDDANSGQDVLHGIPPTRTVVCVAVPRSR